MNADVPLVLLRLGKLILHGFDRQLEHAQLADPFSNLSLVHQLSGFGGGRARSLLLRLSYQRNGYLQPALQDFVIAGSVQPSMAILG